MSEVESPGAHASAPRSAACFAGSATGAAGKRTSKVMTRSPLPPPRRGMPSPATTFDVAGVTGAYYQAVATADLNSNDPLLDIIMVDGGLINP